MNHTLTIVQVVITLTDVLVVVVVSGDGPNNINKNAVLIANQIVIIKELSLSIEFNHIKANKIYVIMKFYLLFLISFVQARQIAKPIIRIENSTTKNWKGDGFFHIDTPIIPLYFWKEFIESSNYPGEIYSPAFQSELSEWDGICPECVYKHFHGFGYFCPCCETLFNVYNVAAKPPYLPDGIYEYYYKPKVNEIYYSQQNVFLNYRGNGNNSEDVYYNPTYKGPLFITGESCTLNNKTGINLFLPEKKFTEEQAVKFQEIINFLTSPSI